MQTPNTFEEASTASEAMFAQNEQPEPVPVADDGAAAENTAPQTDSEAAAEDSAQQTSAEENASVLEDAAQTAELAAQTAAEKDSQYNMAMQEIEALKQQNQQLQGTIDELSKQNTENILEEALTPPALDINGLAFADEETQRAAMAKYAEELSAYNRQQLMSEMSPALEFAKRGMREAEKSETIEALSQIPELASIREMLPQLDRLIENNKWLSSEDMPMDERYIAAYAMAKGIDSINHPPMEKAQPKEPTTEELMALYNGNSAFREMVEKQRLEAIKHSQQVPPMSGSSGAAGAALNIKDKPQTLEEASKRIREMFGGM